MLALWMISTNWLGLAAKNKRQVGGQQHPLVIQSLSAAQKQAGAQQYKITFAL